jgi:LysM repeat protein
MKLRSIIITAFFALGSALLTLGGATTSAQSPTEEPTKRPYVFPTPVFIPTYPNDTPPPSPTRVPPTVTPNTTPGATTVPDQPPGDQTYTVQSGDSLWIIAQKVYGNGAKYPLIAAANDITTTTRLRTGMILKIPGAPGIVTLTPIALAFSPTPAVVVMPTAVPTTPLPSPTPSPTKASFNPAAIAGTASTAITLFSAILALASLVAGVLAYLMYARARRLRRIEEGKPPLRLQ